MSNISEDKYNNLILDELFKNIGRESRINSLRGRTPDRGVFNKIKKLNNFKKQKIRNKRGYLIREKRFEVVRDFSDKDPFY